MPSAKVLEQKKQIVEGLVARLNAACAGVIVDYKGITVLEDTALRRELRAAGIEYTVVKNTLLRFAVDKCNLNEFDSVLNGTTSLATTEGDPIAPIRIVSEFAKKMNGKFEVKAFTPAYQLMCDRAMARFPEPGDNEKTGQINLEVGDTSVICDGLTPEAAAYAKAVIDGCCLIPQEILTKRDL